MSAKRIVRRTLKTRRLGRTDWKRVDALTDAEIECAVRSDPDAAPIVDREWFKTVKVVMPEPEQRKELLTIRVDCKVVDWVRPQRVRYQTRMNAVPRAYCPVWFVGFLLREIVAAPFGRGANLGLRSEQGDLSLGRFGQLRIGAGEVAWAQAPGLVAAGQREPVQQLLGTVPAEHLEKLGFELPLRSHLLASLSIG